MTTHGTSSDTRSAAPAIGPSPAERHEPSRPGCGASGAIGAGLVASGPAWLSAGLAACTSCVSAGGTAFAGAAGGAGLSTGGIALGVVLLGVVAGVQLLRLRRACPTGTNLRGRALRRIVSLAAWATVTFALTQWILVPWLTSQTTSTPGPSLP